MRILRLKLNDILIFAGILLVLSCTCAYQMNVAGQDSAKPLSEMNYLPSGTFLKGIALGYDEAFADFLWVRTVGYFGAHVETDRDFTWLTHMLGLVTELDPLYESPYELAGVILPSELNMVDEGMAFLEKGVRTIPKHNRRYWLQPFYLGFCYMIYKDDPLQAAHYFGIAANYPQSPPYLPLLIARLYGRAGKHGVGIDILQSILKKKPKDTKHEKYLHRSLEKRLKELFAEQDIRMLENAVSTFAATFHHPPSQLNDLVDGLILPFIPDAPFGGRYFLSPGSGDVLSTRLTQNFEVHPQKDNGKMVVSPPSP